MAKQRNKLWTVVKFEISRNLKKPSFWLAALMLPILLVGYMFMAGMTGVGVGEAIESGADTADLRLGLLDEAGIVEGGNFVSIESRESGVDEVKEGNLDVFYFVPANFSENPLVDIYAKTDRTGLLANYEEPIRVAISQSAASRMETADIIAVTGAYEIKTTTYAESGEEDDVIGRMVIPVVVLILFFILICMFGNRLTMATIEEKENRISEMLLTSISPTTLVLGKIISLIALGLIQVVVLMVPVVIFYLYGSTQAILPTGLDIDWSFWTVFSSALLLIFSYFLFTGLSVALGALVPTAKELAPFMSIFMVLVILPFFSISSFMSPDPSFFTYFLSYFPLSAPMALMMRNAFGVLPAWEMGLGLVAIAIYSVLALLLAVYIFRRSAMDFNSKISVGALLAKGTRKKW